MINTATSKWALLIVVITIPLVFCYFRLRQEKLYSDPKSFGGEPTDDPWAVWPYFFRPKPATPCTQKLAGSDFSIISEPNKMIVDIREDCVYRLNHWQPKPPLQLSPTPGTYQVETEDGIEIVVEHLVISYQLDKDQFLQQVYSLPGMARLVPKAETAFLEKHQITVVEEEHMPTRPTLTLHIKGENIDQLKEISWMYNLDTQGEISNEVEGTFGKSETEQFLKFRFNQWHPSPALIILGLDPLHQTQRSINPMAGAITSFEHFDLGIFLTKEIEGKAEQTDPPHRYHFEVQPTANEYATIFGYEVFNLERHVGDHTIDYHLIDGTIVSRPSYNSGLQFVHSIPHRLEDIREIKASFPKSPYRNVRLQFPTIPGLPEANQNLDNLFAATIPYVEFNPESYWQSYHYIKSFTRMKQNFIHQKNMEPQIYRNKTLQQILSAEQKRHGLFRISNKGGILQADKFSLDWLATRLWDDFWP